MKKFKPMKAPNDCVSLKIGKGKLDVSNLTYPILASEKLDGIRCIFKKGQMLTCSLKTIQSNAIREKFEQIRKYSEERGIVIDGEIYCPEITFKQITSMVMTQDYTTKTSIERWEKVCKKSDNYLTREEALDKLRFYCFDCIVDDNVSEQFIDRAKETAVIQMDNQFLIERVLNIPCKNKEEVHGLFMEYVNKGGEGLILRSSEGRYKFGRGTLKEGLIYKVKPYETFDAKIIEVIQATEVDPKAEKKINELGRSVTSKKKEDRIPIEKAAAFLVKYNGHFVKAVLAMNDEEKVEVWANREQYIGKYIEYKGLLVGSDEVPRHPNFVRFREDKDEI